MICWNTFARYVPSGCCVTHGGEGDEDDNERCNIYDEDEDEDGDEGGDEDDYDDDDSLIDYQ